MSENKNMSAIRVWISITLLSLIALITFYELGINLNWTSFLKIMSISTLILLLIAYYFGFVKSGLWRFTHRHIDSLDEREIKLTGKSLRFSYAIFTVIVMILIYIFSLLDIRLSVVLAAGLLLFAHLLPATVLAFSEKDLRL